MSALAPVVMAQPHHLHDRRPRPVHSGRPPHRRLRFGTGLPPPKRRRDRNTDEPVSHHNGAGHHPGLGDVPRRSGVATPATSALAARSGPGTTPIGSPSSTATAGAETPTRVTLDFTTAWTRTTLAQPAWLAALKPLVIPEYLAALSTVDPARVPATRTRDTGRLLSTSGQQSLVQVATNAGGMTVTLVLRTRSLGDRDPHCR